MENMKEIPLDILVLGGQSNAEGYGIGEVAREYIPDERILWMCDDANPHFTPEGFCIDYPAPWHTAIAEEPIGDTGKRGRLAFSFAQAYVEAGYLAAGRRILVIHAAVGGTGFCRGEWGRESVLYRRLCDMTETALSWHPENRLVAFLWHQGECDAFENADLPPQRRYEIHKAKLGEMLADFDRRFGLPRLPFVTGGFCDEWYRKHRMACDAILKAVREVTEARNGAFVETADLQSNNRATGNGDDIHFSRASAYILGERMLSAYSQLQSCTERATP